ncbi:unnamed protein product [Darwinula stevensoni]|uniref:Uncharacterized protein n=1 Tax=Darwinula stevensoni TaxID=69355 RepID=A0A7R8XJQ4_9CRUS|nr:unnamed protein product [Darwinula stevensoni]CAG0895035.1 unnamed protein product [Darwinula stevensoni]
MSAWDGGVIHDRELDMRICRVELDGLRLQILHSGESSRGAGYVNLLFFPPARMSSFLSHLRDSCFTSTYFNTTAGTAGNKIIACSSDANCNSLCTCTSSNCYLKTLGTTRFSLRSNYNNFLSCLRTISG